MQTVHIKRILVPLNNLNYCFDKTFLFCSLKYNKLIKKYLILVNIK